MNRQIRMLIALALIVLAAYIADIPLPIPQQKPEVNGFYRVMQVYDGDTISILKDGERVSVRLIGIDSPEVDTPYTKAECFGTEASDGARELLTGKMVRIETDPTQEMYDIYQRLLAYVYLQDGTFVNQRLVEDGSASEYTFKKPYTHQSEFKAAEADAHFKKKGLWGSCGSS